MKIGHALTLEVYGESHAPLIGMRMTGFPENAVIDETALRAFMERRAPGRDAFSTPRRESDIPELTRRGETVEAIIRNNDTRSGDYERTVPRPGHADYPNWVKTGRIPAGGGSNSGRMTAAMCAAGGICLQELARRGISVTAKILETGDVMAAKEVGDSVGGIIECTVTGLPVGLGGSMFDGLDGALAFAAFGIPGVKGVEFGNGFRAARLRGSENNDAFRLDNGKVVTETNNHGGILGGMTSGMPLVFRVALKPTPSIYMDQKSVDLATMTETVFKVRGRHDPCIVFRAVPVVEALAAFAILDAILTEETGVCYGPVDPSSLENVVIDETVAKLHPAFAQKAICVIPSGEEHKTIETVAKIWSAFARAGIGRKDRVTAVGGGVTGDLTGFAAATWMRGIEWINVPTTLLAMVDASYGGKTACDLPEGKNLAGAFHPPRKVLMDLRFLTTLPERRLADGRAEMIKHAVLGGLDQSFSAGAIPDEETLRRNLAVKIGIVRKDPTEKTGERLKLNCGHTIGHAVEKASDYTLSHGEAVAIGCVEEARLAERLGLAEPGWADELAARFAAAGLPTELPAGQSMADIAAIMHGDKKRDGASVVFALPCGHGDVRAVRLVCDEKGEWKRPE